MFYNDGTGTQFRKEVFDQQANATYGLSVGDLSGNGAPDIAIANSDASNPIFLARKVEVGNAKAAQPQRKTSEPKKPVLQSVDLATFLSRDEYRNTDWPAFRGAGERGVAEGFSLPINWNADSKSGELQNVVWQVDVPGLGHSSPVIVGNKLFLLTAVAKDGVAPLKVQSGGRPTAADDNGTQDWILLCYDKTDGKELWNRTLYQGEPRATRHAKATHADTNDPENPFLTCRSMNDDNPVPSPFEANGLIYITNAHGGPAPIFAIRPDDRGELDSSDEAVVWSVKIGGCYMSTPVVYGDQIHLGYSNGVVRTFHSVTGQKLGERRLGRKAGVIASLVAGDGRIYCASENGTVYVLEHGPELKIIAENSMDSPCLATPAFSGGTIFVRTTKRLATIALPKKAE